ncbi:MAG: 50S ribosomal protein L6 [Chloroflexi bacterium]|nr:50S ribosomal protein L6 [Chloroflexota bacterium]MCL0055114.1 50S ribosomal protein L6 [Dehalococcoidia bacterium]MCS5658944.1 50S ribosomal protein L6 [Dehalococcoidia bacterium]HAE32673.1 50S ribosomal protein L6 [Dehalococcoidia bacterium]|tara:strand:+ start:1227 stop:1769 length:543 start_codon:yes stop_codon:yes gene_type:complete
MSRIGKQPIAVPTNVEVKIDGSFVTVTGPRGELSNSFNSEMIISKRDGEISVERPSDESQHKAFHGLTRSLIANMVTGVSDGYEKDLELVGIGYRVQQTGKGVTLSVMLSHTVLIEPPEGVTLEVLEGNRVKVSGIDKQAVGQIAAQIRKVRPPNVYTGKGIRYAGEYVRIKPGKSARRA